MSGLGLPQGGSSLWALAHPPTALVHVPPKSGSPIWEKGSAAASTTLHRVLPREVTHVDRGFTSLSFGRMIQRGGSHCISSSTT